MACDVERFYADVQELLASLGEPLGSEPDTDTVQSGSLERGDDDAVSRAVPASPRPPPCWHYEPCFRSFNAATN